MKAWIGDLWRLVLITFLGFVGGMIAGLMTYGGDVFNSQSVAFAYYIVYGLSTAFIFAFYHIRGLSSTITAAVITGVAIFIIATRWMAFLNSAVWSFGVNLSVVMLAFLFEQKLSYFKHWKFVVIAIIYGGVFVLLTLIVVLITEVALMSPKLFQDNFLDGFKLGVGLGIGVEIAESIIHSIDLHKKAKNS
jgi:hypothetical protein